ncbi:MAG: iron-sulfur cluster assembly accessory protein [Nitrospirota bacterium]|nr:MAG: iron-sulfur cluster assembly accessory protein [Nitrospirota bacterium]
MLNVSEAAAEKIGQILKAESKEDWGLRMFMEAGGCCPSLGLDIVEAPLDGDEAVESNGVKVFISKDIIPSVKGMTLEFIDNGEHQGFGLTGGEPASGDSCGPGCSSCGHD